MFETKANAATKWLQIMFYIALVSLINSVITLIPVIPAGLTTWISRGIMMAFVFCTYQLSAFNEHYRKAAIYRAIMVVCTLGVAFLFKSNVLTFVGSIFSIMAVYQEYSAHSEMIREKDSKLAGKWHSLFYWGLVAGILISFGTIITAVLAAVSGLDISTITAFVLAVLSILQIVLDVVYVLYLKRTILLLDVNEEMNNDL